MFFVVCMWLTRAFLVMSQSIFFFFFVPVCQQFYYRLQCGLQIIIRTSYVYNYRKQLQQQYCRRLRLALWVLLVDVAGVLFFFVGVAFFFFMGAVFFFFFRLHDALAGVFSNVTISPSIICCCLHVSMSKIQNITQYITQ